MNTELLQKAYHFLSLRDHSIKEISDKLKRKSDNKVEIEEVIAHLKKNGYLDDLSFAGKYVAYRLGRGNVGHQKIRYELLKKGVKKEYIDQVFATNEYNEVELARDLLEKKSKSLAGLEDFQKRNKLFSYFKNRGFKPETIYKVLENC